MKLIAGLGNPEKKYENTPHNAGFAVVDLIAEMLGTEITHNLKQAKTATAIYEGEKIILAKPQTYMNLSGESIAALSDYYKIDEEDILVIVDDVNLEPGRIRVRADGSAGGHNGLKNIILNLATEDFPRIRVGVGGGENKSLIGYVLSKISKEEQKVLDEAFEAAAKAALCWIKEGTEQTMNLYNSTGKKDKDAGI